jgi:hypothetical protein
MTVTATEIDLTQWHEDELRDDIRGCLTALGLLSQESAARAGVADIIADAVAELLRRATAGPEARATMCQCGEVFTAPDDATVHFVRGDPWDNATRTDVPRSTRAVMVPGTAE